MAFQEEIFLKEGDIWFERNLEKLLQFKYDDVLPYFRENKLSLKRILDVGCCFGRLLHEVSALTSSAGYGLDPSEKAVAYGRSLYPDLNLQTGLAHDLGPYESGFFDLVMVSSVFHWIDRSRLLGAVSEIDRVLADGGLLLIRDFSPENPCKVAYHHLPNEEVFTYKQPYQEIFTTSNLYCQIFINKFLHDPAAGKSDQNMYQMVVLKKNLRDNYPEVNLEL